MKYNDNELVYYIKEGNSDDAKILYDKYYPYIKSYVSKMLRKYDFVGLEESDLCQEGIIGFINAIDSYDENKDIKFFTFAKACVEKKIISAIVHANREKNRVMNESLPINDMNFNFFQMKSPYDFLIECEDEYSLLNTIKCSLTDFEDQVLQLRLSGVKNLEMCNILDVETKTIDNAIYRIRRKVKKILNK